MRSAAPASGSASDSTSLPMRVFYIKLVILALTPFLIIFISFLVWNVIFSCKRFKRFSCRKKPVKIVSTTDLTGGSSQSTSLGGETTKETAVDDISEDT